MLAAAAAVVTCAAALFLPLLGFWHSSAAAPDDVAAAGESPPAFKSLVTKYDGRIEAGGGGGLSDGSPSTQGVAGHYEGQWLLHNGDKLGSDIDARAGSTPSVSGVPTGRGVMKWDNGM